MAVRSLSRRSAGITLIELLVVLAVMGILLGVLTAYFATQTRATTKSQTENSVRDKVRAVGEALSQDFELAGARAIYVYDSAIGKNAVKYADPRTNADPADACTSQYRAGCVAVAGGVTSIWYRTSLDPSAPCHRVNYWLDSSSHVLYRNDEACGLGIPSSWSTDDVFAKGISAMTIQYNCGDGMQYADPATCYAGGTENSFVRSVSIDVRGYRTVHGQDATASFAIDSPTPNLRLPVTYWVTPSSGG